MDGIRQVTLRYRPKTWSEVLGQEAVVSVLRNSAARRDFKSSYLFHGPRGTGKTSLARIFAKAMNCDTGPDPCGLCVSCLGIDSGKSQDTLEFDAAAGRTVDYVEQLHSLAMQVADRGKRRIFILDEVHMLSPTAMNSILKLLEESPPQVTFISVTTEPHKVLATIRSRSLCLPFSPLPSGAIKASIERIFLENGVACSPVMAEKLARNSDGSLRDVQQQVDQLLQAAPAEGITEAYLQTTLGILAVESYRVIGKALALRDFSAWVSAVTSLLASGIQLPSLELSVEKLVRDWAAYSSGATVDFITGLSHEDYSQWGKLSEAQVSRFVEALDGLRREIHFASSPRVAFELFFYRVVASTESELVEVKKTLAALHVLVERLATQPVSPVQGNKLLSSDPRIALLEEDPVMAYLCRENGWTIQSLKSA